MKLKKKYIYIWGFVPKICCGYSLVQEVARSRHRFSPQGRVGRCARVQYWHLDARGKGSVVDHCKCSFGYTVILGAVCWRELLLDTPLVA